MHKATKRLYLSDDHCYEAQATVIAVDGARFACDQSCFYPGGGGQPPDQGMASPAAGRSLPVVSVALEQRVVWHQTDQLLSRELVGQAVEMKVDAPRRDALTRGHTALHILNTIALREYGAWITGAQIGVDYSRIDFNFEGFTQTNCRQLERAANEVIVRDLPLHARLLSEAEFRARPDLARTLEVRPPLEEGRVRVVAIRDFDEQACGGTHVSSTSKLGQLSIMRLENKGRANKRLYVRLSVV